MRAILHSKEEGVEDAGNGWDRPYVVYEILAYRTGWIGAWDAIKAAWRKDRRLQLPTDLSTSLYVKEAKYVWGCQVENGNRPSVYAK
jgi:hypothetical protein